MPNVRYVLVVVVVVVHSRPDQIAFYSSIDSTPVVQVARRKSITVIQDAVNSHQFSHSHVY